VKPGSRQRNCRGGGVTIYSTDVTADGRGYVYGYQQVLHNLFVARGVH
jgi:hypothetical protein